MAWRPGGRTPYFHKRSALPLLRPGGRVLVTVAFALAGSLPLAMFWTRDLLGNLYHPVRQAWMNRNIEPRTRATVLSFQEQIASMGEIGGGPPLGWVGSRFGVRAAIVAAGLVFSPVIAVFLRAAHLRDHVAGPHAPIMESPPAELA
ncbi:MAG TPA: hypothetical protein VGR22_06210 [Thermomicrobiales bacterium]|nr:hypothetical protein [Thermomicrobiales bacterium]